MTFQPATPGPWTGPGPAFELITRECQQPGEHHFEGGGAPVECDKPAHWAGAASAPALDAAARRELRRQELARRTKADLIRMLRPHVMTAHPLSKWTKDEIVSSLLDREFPSAAGR